MNMRAVSNVLWWVSRISVGSTLLLLLLRLFELGAAVAVGCNLVLALVAVTQTTSGRVLGLHASNLEPFGHPFSSLTLCHTDSLSAHSLDVRVHLRLAWVHGRRWRHGLGCFGPHYRTIWNMCHGCTNMCTIGSGTWLDLYTQKGMAIRIVANAELLANDVELAAAIDRLGERSAVV